VTRRRHAAIEALRRFWSRAYARVPNEDRFAEGSAAYKKGWEIRFVADSPAECDEISRLLGAAGFVPGRRFAKGSGWIVPVYGREPTERLRALLGR
jgi:hypothetical protein